MTESTPANKPKYVFVLVHGDIWGAYNANMLVEAVVKNNAIPLLFVSTTALAKDGYPVAREKDLKIPRILKESNLADFFRVIDKVFKIVPNSKRLHTFEGLARQFTPDGVVHRTTCGGEDGGLEMAEMFRKLKEEQGIAPELILSGDTMAILPKEVTDNIICISGHPAPLDRRIKIPGMKTTLRALCHRIVYDSKGRLLPRWEPISSYIGSC
jgi:hypothetical protein